MVFNSRFLYVRNASGLVNDKAKWLHIMIMLFLFTYHINRLGSWTLAQLWQGFNYESMPIGKFCMMTNLTLTWDGINDPDYRHKFSRNRTLVLVNMFLFDLALTFACLAALTAR